MNKNRFLLGALIIGNFLFSIACNDSSGKKLNEIPVNVKVLKVNTVNENQTISYSGTIEESESIPLSFSVVGNISKVFVSEGDKVGKGQLLAEINDETYRNTYEMSLASLKQAEDAYKRLLPMYKNGNLPEIKLIEVETSLQQAKSAASITKKNVDDCKLFSPVDGIVGKKSIEPGMSAIPNLTSINIININKVFAKIPIPENEISNIKIGDKAKIKIAALDNSEYEGTVEEIGIVGDPITHTYKIKIEIVNTNNHIRPGMICNATLYKANSIHGLVLPNEALIVDENGRKFVYSINQNKAQRIFVKTGELLKDGVEIIDGLSDGEEIVIAGQQKLVDNSLIRIVNK